MKNAYFLGLLGIASALFSAFTFSSTALEATERSPLAVNVNALTRLNFEDSLSSLYSALQLKSKGLSYDAFRYGMIGYYSLAGNRSATAQKQIISIIDFTKPSKQKRFYTIDLAQHKVLFHSYVSHGRNTGEDKAVNFSNVPHSNQSSLGFYITGETYFGSKGYSMKLDGVDAEYNSNLRSRAVVMHDADYVSEAWIKKYGRLGRSQGCPALPKEICKTVIDTIKEGTVIFAYYNDPSYIGYSNHLNLDALFNRLDALQKVTNKVGVL